MKIFRTDQKFEIKIDSISVFVSPLTWSQKQELQDLYLKAQKGSNQDAMKMIVQAMKYSIKEIKGVHVEDDEGNDIPYQVEIVEGQLSDSSVDDLLNMPCNQKLTQVCAALLGGVPDKIVDPQTGKPIDGVIVCSNKAKVPARKK